MKTKELFPELAPLPTKRRVMMHHTDAGPGSPNWAEFVCKRCGWDESYGDVSEEELRRGIPCPKCNKASMKMSIKISLGGGTENRSVTTYKVNRAELAALVRDWSKGTKPEDSFWPVLQRLKRKLEEKNWRVFTIETTKPLQAKV